MLRYDDKMFRYLLVAVVIISNASAQRFSENFQFGTATAAYQIEGAWNVSGKSQSNWDYYTHTFPDYIGDRSNGDIACLAYYQIDEEVANLKQLNVSFYRFSIAWTRILPTGYSNDINQDGVDYYNELIDKLVANKIEPIVTIYHWDMPQTLQDLGGWANSEMPLYLASYARVLFRLFGDRVKRWITLNEPISICYFGYESRRTAPFLRDNNVGDYMCGHNLILGHAKTYHVYQKEFKATQNGRVGITMESPWFEPNTTEDALAAEQMVQFFFGQFAHPVFSKEGDYPKIVRQRVDRISKIQGFEKSRLPRFTREQVNFIKGSADFLGLNHYTSYIALKIKQPNYTVPSFDQDAGALMSYNENWEPTARDSFKVVPWGLRKMLIWIKKNYDNPEVLITENGYAGGVDEGLKDYGRVNYNNRYLIEVSKAINEHGCHVTGYTAWSYMDNFEWSDGYTLRFGLYHVDFNDTNRPRTPKLSAYSFQNIIYTREVNTSFTPTKFLH